MKKSGDGLKEFQRKEHSVKRISSCVALSLSRRDMMMDKSVERVDTK